MYLHLGADTVVTFKEIIGVFDLDTSTVSKVTRDALADAQRAGEVVTVSPELPKSFVLCDGNESNNKIFISPVSTATLIKRVRSAGRRPKKRGD